MPAFTRRVDAQLVQHQLQIVRQWRREAVGAAVEFELKCAACRNRRFRPSSRNRLLASLSPYFGSPASGCPTCAACTRIWCVRPVASVACDQTGARDGVDFPEESQRRLAIVVHPHHAFAALQHRFPQRRIDVEIRALQLPVSRHRYCLRDFALADQPPAHRSGPRACAANTSTPEVSRSSLCASSRCSCGRAARSNSIAPMSNPAAAMTGDAGRLVDDQEIAILEDHGCPRAERNQTRGRVPSDPGRRCAPAESAAGRLPSRRVSGFARLPLTRTWPVRSRR